MSTYAIGDIHGCAAALKTLDETLGFSADDTVIALGDYINRGPDSRGVIDHLIELQERCNLIALRGNHEVMMLQAPKSKQEMAQWLEFGGIETMKSYAVDSLHDIPKPHWEFIHQTLPYHEGENDIFVHANLSYDLDLADQSDEMLYWEHLNKFIPHKSGKRMICGHTSQDSGEPLLFNGAVCIDTKAHANSWLTCLNVDTDQYWQANQQGEVREKSLLPR